MAIDFSKPSISDNYSTGYTQSIKDAQLALAQLLDNNGTAVTVTSGSAGIKRYNPTSDLLEQYNGTSWATLPLAYLPSTGGTVTGTSSFTALQVGTSSVWHAGNLTPSAYMPTSGGTFSAPVYGTEFRSSGRVFANGTNSGNGLGKITVSTSSASGGAQGDVWFQY